MIKCHLSRLMGEKKLKMVDVARGCGIPRRSVSKLYYEKAKRVDFETLDKLCWFFECQVGDLLEFIPDDE